MELKHVLMPWSILMSTVLIVPFMELKQQMVKREISQE